MKFTLDNGTADYRITAYESHAVCVNETWYEHAIVVSPDRLEKWEISSIESLAPDQVELLLADQPEIIVLGTGESQQFPPSALLQPLYSAGVGVEIMDTAAACRTYNILMSEDRRVVAALLMR